MGVYIVHTTFSRRNRNGDFTRLVVSFGLLVTFALLTCHGNTTTADYTDKSVNSWIKLAMIQDVYRAWSVTKTFSST